MHGGQWTRKYITFSKWHPDIKQINEEVRSQPDVQVGELVFPNTRIPIWRRSELGYQRLVSYVFIEWIVRDLEDQWLTWCID